jgi:hypothetical protein
MAAIGVALRASGAIATRILAENRASKRWETGVCRGSRSVDFHEGEGDRGAATESIAARRQTALD